MFCKRPCFLYRSLINHPKNFGETEDISVDKNVFENKLELVYDPRSHSVKKISFAGIKINKKYIIQIGNVMSVIQNSAENGI